LAESGFTLDRKALQVIFRYAFEEQMRRSISSDAEPLSKTQLLKILFPDYQETVGEAMEIIAQEIQLAFSKGEDDDGGMSRYVDMAFMFKSLAGSDASTPTATGDS
jgi:hypothetical protein